MPKQVWICDKCDTQYPDESSARQCESSHCADLAFKVLMWLPRSYVGEDCRFPLRIRVTIVGERDVGGYGSATYTLERVGPKGC